MNTKIKLLFIIVLINLISCSDIAAKNASWYLPWNNSIDNLIPATENEMVPLLLNGANYRVLKVYNPTKAPLSLNTNNIILSNNGITLKVSALLVIKNYKNQEILDPILPLQQNNPIVLKANATAYFLLKFEGNKSGITTVSVRLNAALPQDNISVLVAKKSFSDILNLNVWAYFNYKLIDGLKTGVINDLVSHNANVLVLPPYCMPAVSNTNLNTNALSKYLNGTKGKFNKYLLFMGLKNVSDQNFMNKTWQANFINWYKAIQKTFQNCGVDFSKVLLYPFDEPNANDAAAFVKMYKWCRSQSINNPFFVTIGNVQVTYLTQYADVAQIFVGSSNVIQNVEKIKNIKSTLWIYEIKSPGKNIAPYNYVSLAWKAQKWNARGIGVWNYSEIGNGFNSNFPAVQQAKLATWNASNTDPVHDYSLIYREGDNIYPSLRWTGLAYGKEDFDFINLYRSKYGTDKTDILINNLLGNKLTLNQWETIKMNLIK